MMSSFHDGWKRRIFSYLSFLNFLFYSLRIRVHEVHHLPHCFAPGKLPVVPRVDEFEPLAVLKHCGRKFPGKPLT